MAECLVSNYSSKRKGAINFEVNQVKGMTKLDDQLKTIIEEKVKSLSGDFATSFEVSLDQESYNQSIKILGKDISSKLKLAIGDKKLINSVNFENEVVNFVVSKFSRVLTENERYIKEQFPEVENIISYDKLDTLKYKEEVKFLYGSTADAMNDQRINIFNNAMRTLLIVDTRGDGKIIDSIEDMNNSITHYLEEQFKILTNYLTSEGYSVHETKMFIEQNNTPSLNPNYLDVLQLMYHYLHNTKSTQSKVENSWLSMGTANGDQGSFYNAVNAYVNILYFDRTLNESLDGFIDIDRRMKEPIKTRIDGTKVITNYKYTIASKEKFQGKNNWDDAIQDSISNVGKYVKVLISSIPVIDYLNNKPTYMQMEAKDFLGSISQLLDVGAKITRTQNNLNFFNAVMSSKNDMKNALPIMLNEIFTNEELRNSLKEKGLDDNALTFLYSIDRMIYKGFEGNRSWNDIEQDYVNENGITDRIGIVDTLLGAADSNIFMNYLQTVYNRDLGQFETSIKSRIASDKTRFDIVNSTNDSIIHLDRKTDILNKYKIKKLDNNKDYTITLFNTTFDATVASSDNILSKVTPLEFSDNISNLFKKLNIDLSNSLKRDNLVSRNNLSSDENLFMDVLTFIDDILGTQFGTTDGLRELFLMNGAHKNNLQRLLSSAVRGLVITDIYDKFENATKPKSSEKYNKSELRTFLKDYPNTFGAKIEEQYGKEAKPYWVKELTGDQLLTVKTNEQWAEDLAKARAILSGKSSVSVISNLEGKKIPMVSMSYLGGKLKQQLTDSRLNRNSTSSLLFVQNPDLILNQCVNTDVKTESGKKKSVRDATFPELMYDSIVCKFIIPYTTSKTIYVQPTVFSDKTKFVQYQIALPSDISLKSSEDDIIDKFISTIGSAYKSVWQNVLNDYDQIFTEPEYRNADGTLNLDSVQTYLKTHKDQEFIQKAYDKNVDVYLDTHYRKLKDGLAINELLYHYANELYTPDVLKRRLHKDKIQFMQNLYSTGIELPIKFKNLFSLTSNFDKSDPITKLFCELTEGWNEKSINEWVSGDQLILARAVRKDGTSREILNGEIEADETLELNPILNSYFLLDTLFGNNLRFSLTGSEINHKVKTLTNLQNIVFTNSSNGLFTTLSSSKAHMDFLNTYSPSYVNSNKVNAKNVVTYYDISKALENFGKTGKTPSIEEANIINDLLKLYNDNIYKVENAAQNAQFKRNVIIPGTMRYYLQNTINGIRPEMNVAIIYDIEAKVFNFNATNSRGKGYDDGIDAHDGAAFINPFTSQLENWSLQDAKVGSIRKPIHHAYNDKYMTATLFKYAVDTITNQWMRQAEGNNNGVRLRKLFKKMTDQQWEPDIDIFECAYDEYAYNFKLSILKDDKLFFKDGNKHYEIVDFNKENGVYYTDEQEVNSMGLYDSKYGEIPMVRYYHYFDENGQHIKSTELKDGYHTINSLFELHTALGGIYSESIGDDGNLQYSEISNKIVSKFINYCSIDLHPEIENKQINQKNYYQPLKSKMIDMVANNTSIKNGAGNINPSSSFYDDSKLKTIKVSTLHYGIQMDADHEADMGEMTEFSQVISSLDAGGRLHEYVSEIYDTLGEIALNLSQLEIDSIKELKNNKTKLYNLVGKVIINNINLNGTAGLANAVFHAVEEEFHLNSDQNLAQAFIPFSDPNIYSSILPSLASSINKKSIKRKYPGQGTVMVPAYDLSMIYEIDGNTYQFMDLIDEAMSQGIEPDPTISDLSLKNRDLVNRYLKTKQAELPIYDNSDVFQPTDIVNIAYTIPNEEINGITVSLNDIKDYYLFKNDINAFLASKGIFNPTNITYQKNVLVPRNLAPAKITWEVNGRQMNIFDHWKVRELFKGLMNGENEAQLRKKYDIQEVFDQLSRGIYETETGEQLKITNLQTKAAELITSNLFKTAFNIKGQDSLAKIKKQGASYFKSSYTKIETDNYDLQYTSRDGNNLCISLRPISTKTDKLDYKKSDWEYSNTVLLPYESKAKGNIVDEIYYTQNNIPLFSIGRRILRKEYTYDPKTKEFKNGNTVLDNYDHRFQVDKNNNVIEKVYFLNRYLVTEKSGNSYELITVNKEKMMEVFPKLEGVDESAYHNQIDHYIGKLLSKIYNSRDFAEVSLNDHVLTFNKGLLATSLREFAKQMSFDSDFNNYLNKLSDLVYESKPDSNNITKFNARKLRKEFSDYQNLLAQKRYTSFLKSQYFTASRIPAQTLQSFMQMQNVGYTGVNNNQCFVSHWQTW